MNGVEARYRVGFEQAVDALSVHEVCANEPGEGERAVDRCLRGLGEAQQQIAAHYTDDAHLRTLYRT